MCRHLLESSILSIVLSELQTSHPPPMAPPSQAGRTSAKWRLTADRPSRSNSEPQHLFVTIANRAERLRLNKVHPSRGDSGDGAEANRRFGTRWLGPDADQKVRAPRGRPALSLSSLLQPPLLPASELGNDGDVSRHALSTRRRPACRGPKEGVPAGCRQATADAHTSSDPNRSAADRSEHSPSHLLRKCEPGWRDPRHP